MPVDPLTPAQLRVFRALRHRASWGGLPPTYRELQGELGFRSTATVRDHLKALQRKGYVRIAARRFRGIQILASNQHRAASKTPGRGSASELRRWNISGWVAEFPPSGALAAVWVVKRVGANSLGLVSGDLVLVDVHSKPTLGEWVASSIDGKTLDQVFENVHRRNSRSHQERIAIASSGSRSGVVRAVIRRPVESPVAITRASNRRPSVARERSKHAAC